MLEKAFEQRQSDILNREKARSNTPGSFS